VVVAENEPQVARLVRPPHLGGHGLDAVWNDDFHHAATVAVTGKAEAYYSDYRGHPQELVSAVKHGFLFQGQRYKWQRARRGSAALDVAPHRFVTFVENHDQIANSATGRRLHQLTSPGRYRAITALLLLAPGTPMLFQGQEFASSAPFLFFADHRGELGGSVRRGRAEFLAQFVSLGSPEAQAALPDPLDPATFARCKLDWSERERHADVLAMHRDLLRLRRDDPVFAAQRRRGVDGAVLGPEALALRFFGDGGDYRLVVVNLGPDLSLNPAPEPLLAPPADTVWSTLWSSESPRYGGPGTPRLETRRNWWLPGHAAVALRPGPAADDPARGGDGPSEEEEMRREALRAAARAA
jgi:maltooligosyltrehalose trehalohydrolase